MVTSLPGAGRATQLARAAGGSSAHTAAVAAGGDSGAEGAAGQCQLTGAPLIRYCIGDAGGLMGFDEMIEYVRGQGYDPLADKAG